MTPEQNKETEVKIKVGKTTSKRHKLVKQKKEMPSKDKFNEAEYTKVEKSQKWNKFLFKECLMFRGSWKKVGIHLYTLGYLQRTMIKNAQNNSET